MAQQQQMAVVQQAIHALTELAFDKCVEKPGSSLGRSETNCIRASVLKYLDTNEFVMGRLKAGKGPLGGGAH